MYECVFIIKPEITQENLDIFVQNCRQEIEKDDGEIMGVEYWGVRYLAYSIKKLNRGNYVMFKITQAKNALHSLQDFARFHNDVLRYTVFRVDQLSTEPSELMREKTADDYSKRTDDRHTTHHSMEEKRSKEVTDSHEEVAVET